MQAKIAYSLIFLWPLTFFSSILQACQQAYLIQSVLLWFEQIKLIPILQSTMAYYLALCFLLNLFSEIELNLIDYLHRKHFWIY